MLEKLLSPIALGLSFLVVSWLFGRIQGSNRAWPTSFWIGVACLITCGRYAIAWHYEIGSAWQSHPTLAMLSTFVVFMLMTRFLYAPSMRENLKRLS
jgi:hypothetical protein